MSAESINGTVYVRAPSGEAVPTIQDEDEQGPLPYDAVCPDVEVGNVMAVRDAEVMRDALARAFGLEGERGGWCSACGFCPCRCRRRS